MSIDQTVHTFQEVLLLILFEIDMDLNTYNSRCMVNVACDNCSK
jgi:hypothetical protein